MKIKNELNKIETVSNIYMGVVHEALNSALQEHHFVPEMATAFRKSFLFYFNKYMKAVSDSIAELNKENDESI